MRLHAGSAGSANSANHRARAWLHLPADLKAKRRQPLSTFGSGTGAAGGWSDAEPAGIPLPERTEYVLTWKAET